MTLSELKRDINDLFGELQNDEALQIIHRGKGIKVILTQERFFELLGLIDQLRGDAPAKESLVEDVSSSTRKQRLRKNLEKLGDDENPKNAT